MAAKTSAPESEGKALEQLIGQITNSDTFRMAPMMRTLLLYLWQQKGAPVSEYAIAVDALGRPPDFDPKTDSTVRVQIARLRAKLKDFYATADNFPLKLSIPLGKHELAYVYAPVAAPSPPAVRSSPAIYIVASGALLCVCVILLLQNQRLKASLPPAAPVLPPVWRSFLESGKPSLVVVPSPLYFYWPEHHVYVRDLTISNFSNWPNSPVLSDLGKKLGSPQLAQTYVGAMEMTTGVRILQFLDKQKPGAQLVESRRFSSESFGNQNIVFLGMPRTTAGYLDRLLENTSFYMAQADPDVIRSRSPKAGEPPEFKELIYSTDRRAYPAIILFPPKRPEGGRSLLLLGRYLTGAASMLLSADGLKLLEETWSKGGSPDAWEMVIESESYRDTLLKTRPVAFRPVPANFWQETK